MYHQVAQAIKQRARTGVYEADMPLPSVRALSSEFGVSLTVIQRAVGYLEEEGMVVSHHGKGITLIGEEGCQQTAITFGFIQPYAGTESFHKNVLGFVDEAFADRYNFVVVRASNHDPVREREIAEHFVANGVKGIILWPTEEDPNGEYFAKLSRTTPVVVVDRLLAGADLPTVVIDAVKLGHDVCQEVFGPRKRMLVVIDDLKVSPYDDTIRGITEAAAEMNRSDDVKVVRIGISDLIRQVTRMNYSNVNATGEQIADLLQEGGFDTLFCTQDNFLDFVLMETGIIDSLPQVQLIAPVVVDGNVRTRKYNEIRPWTWSWDSAEVVSKGADIVQRWVLSRNRPQGITRIPQRRIRPA